MTGHIQVFLRGRAPLAEYIFFFWLGGGGGLGFDVKESCSCFDGVVCRAVFNIHAADQDRRAEGEEIFGQTES